MGLGNTSLNIRIVITLGLLALLTACGNTKSTTNTATSSASIYSTKALAYCNKSTDSNFSFNSSVVKDASGNVSADAIKIKFSYLNANITKSGNIIKFFKWKVSGSSAVLDSTPLNVSMYDFASGSSVSSASNYIDAYQFNGTYGVYLQLNDPSATYQVIKVVAYDSSGNIIGYINSLIPAFYANPADYAYNSDGTARSSTLQAMHPLYGTTTDSTAASTYFNNFCF